MYRLNSYAVRTVFLPAFLIVLALFALPATASARRSIAFHADELAPASACAGQTAELSGEEQVAVMLCMTNYARAANGLAPLHGSRQLRRSAEEKSSDILTCDDFSHEACGRPFTFWDKRNGYLKGCWKAAENIAWGTGDLASVRAIFTAWLNSPEHHENILGPYKEVGIGLRIGTVEGYEGAVVWTQDFGSHKC
jgi:uncharacterized protein YkwD